MKPDFISELSGGPNKSRYLLSVENLGKF